MSWDRVGLSTVADVFNGKTPSKAEQRDEGFPVLKIKDVDENFKFRGAFQSFVDDEFYAKHKAKKIQLHDSMILNAAHNSDYVGSKQYCAEEDVVDSVATGEWLVCRAKQGVLSPKFLNFWLRSEATRFEMKGLVKGIHLYPKDVARLEIPLPPLETQKQIAAILEKADQLRKDCQQMEQELNNLAQSVFMDMFGDPVSNPKGWNKASLRSISTKFNDGPFGSNLKTSHYRDSGVQVIRLTNIGTGWFKNDDRAFVSVEHAETLEKFHCKPGDIVIATLGDPNLRACIIPDEVPLAINKADCVHCVPNTKIVRKEYLVEFLNLPSTLRSIENKLHGQTRTRISSGQLAEVDVLIPPLSEQDKFMNAIWLRDKELKRLQDQNVAFEDLFNSLMQKAFNGELNIKNKAA
ncbi:Restriction endonuclease S subunit [Hahella chejuensis KCTC 2396]|uniref:Restriction endonuclease S subunit n=1 Tax=Hahella chejuensis (strain KCTC 2396) TaxID=349521 RepID=Q2SCB3_HAHCH|nr:restriction endonuclease subunit S [Hahella chejuensis]ABC31711.1 Restriction endonuclease S subunit [Hahella chejuensis KCTC 2396]